MNNFLGTEMWQALLDIIFPERCLGCGIGLKEIRAVSYCQECRQDIRIIQEPYCTTCGRPFVKSAGTSHQCSYCLTSGWYFSRARAVVHYQEPIAEAVKLYKYNGMMYGLKTFAALARRFIVANPLPVPDLILPVPLHTKRLRQRGFNQALILAQKIFPEYRAKIDPYILKRHHWLRPQTGLQGAERRRNVKNAFNVSRPDKIEHRKVLLVDDVFTTGATVNECARVLLKNKVSEVNVFTFARVID